MGFMLMILPPWKNAQENFGSPKSRYGCTNVRAFVSFCFKKLWRIWAYLLRLR
jgi:hypothetical protein